MGNKLQFSGIIVIVDTPPQAPPVNKKPQLSGIVVIDDVVPQTPPVKRGLWKAHRDVFHDAWIEDEIADGAEPRGSPPASVAIADKKSPGKNLYLGPTIFNTLKDGISSPIQKSNAQSRNDGFDDKGRISLTEKLKAVSTRYTAETSSPSSAEIQALETDLTQKEDDKKETSLANERKIYIEDAIAKCDESWKGIFDRMKAEHAKDIVRLEEELRKERVAKKELEKLVEGQAAILRGRDRNSIRRANERIADLTIEKDELQTLNDQSTRGASERITELTIRNDVLQNSNPQLRMECNEANKKAQGYRSSLFEARRLLKNANRRAVSFKHRLRLQHRDVRRTLGAANTELDSLEQVVGDLRRKVSEASNGYWLAYYELNDTKEQLRKERFTLLETCERNCVWMATYTRLCLQLYFRIEKLENVLAIEYGTLVDPGEHDTVQWNAERLLPLEEARAEYSEGTADNDVDQARQPSDIDELFQGGYDTGYESARKDAYEDGDMNGVNDENRRGGDGFDGAEGTMDQDEKQHQLNIEELDDGEYNDTIAVVYADEIIENGDALSSKQEAKVQLSIKDAHSEGPEPVPLSQSLEHAEQTIKSGASSKAASFCSASLSNRTEASAKTDLPRAADLKSDAQKNPTSAFSAGSIWEELPNTSPPTLAFAEKLRLSDAEARGKSKGDVDGKVKAEPMFGVQATKYYMAAPTPCVSSPVIDFAPSPQGQPSPFTRGNPLKQDGDEPHGGSRGSTKSGAPG